MTTLHLRNSIDAGRLQRLAFPSHLARARLLCAFTGQRKHVVPAPDGGYPGGNTAGGQSALLSLTSGYYNTAVGFVSLSSDTTGAFNTAVGAGTLLANTADENTATGAAALLINTTGSANTAHGAFALFNNTNGFNNTAIGNRALFSNSSCRPEQSLRVFRQLQHGHRRWSTLKQHHWWPQHGHWRFCALEQHHRRATTRPVGASAL